MLRRGFMAATLTAAPSPHPGAGPAKPRLLYDVREFGAKGGRVRNEAAQFQAAIDACHGAGGGTVCIPAGDFLCGSLFLKSHVALYLDAGATVYASTKPEDFQPGAPQLITAQKAEYISILGPGVLHGGGIADLGRRPGFADEPRPKFRTRVILFEDCRQVILSDFTLLYSDSWACHLRFCEKVVVDGVTIRNNFFHTNSDGIDPESCRDVRISNCHITAGDDCICLKTDNGVPCEDIVVTNCTTESIATAIKLGTGSFGDYRNITISNCTVRNSTVGVGFFIKDGGTIDGVTVSNLTIETLRDPMQVNPERLRNMIYPIFLDIEKRRDGSAIGGMRNILFSNIVIHSDNGILIQGMRESAIENLTLSNICFRVTAPFDYSQKKKHAGGTINPNDDRLTIYARHPTYCAVANVRNLFVDNLSVQVDEKVSQAFPRSALALMNVDGAILRAVRRSPSEKAGPAVETHGSGGVSVS
ncbi:MAG: glycosyl hydrolase family 28 protein [Acidobacteria bacterium]|nr:glycosyl hydrolase family 28 protein [Acidobacteriota bacterium]